ncbi:UNVERIFIED_ORG: hypothetical protein J2W66_003129 [Agrobacterium larrymoorei]|nr:hypothetical protein [Agrobacterium larrymoorei]
MTLSAAIPKHRCASPEVVQFRRALLEAKIEELIALLDLLDGDENLEPYLADSDPETEDREDEDEREPEDPEENGDEEDFSNIDDEYRPGGGNLRYDGSGEAIARRLLAQRQRRHS